MATKIQLRRDTAANWSSNNPILSEGEIGYDSTNKTLKVGDGTTDWSTLPAIQSSTTVDLSPYATTVYVDGAVFSGDYNDLTNTPTTFSGDYNDLTNTPTVPTVGFETKVLDDYVEKSIDRVSYTGTVAVDPADGTIQYGTFSGAFTISPTNWDNGQTVSLFASGSGTGVITLAGALFSNADNEIDGNSIITITKVNSTYWVSISKGYA